MSPPDLFANTAASLHEEEKSPVAFKTISEAAELLDVPAHVLRFWESRFTQLKPIKSKGGRRYYRPEDIAILTQIRHLLYERGYTIKGAQQVVGKPMEVIPVPARPDLATVSHKPPAKDKTALLRLKSELSEMRAMLKSALQKR